MKRKTIDVIQKKINEAKTPPVTGPSRYDSVHTLKKHPRLEWRFETTSLTPGQNTPFPLCKDVLFHISSFLVPEKTSNLQDFLKSLRNDTLILNKISKKNQRVKSNPHNHTTLS